MLSIYLRGRGLVLPLSLWLLSLIIVSIQSYQAEWAHPSPFARGVATLLSYPGRSYTYIKDEIKSRWHRYFYLVGVQEENLKLQKRVSLLELKNQMLEEQARENARLRSLLEFKNALNFQTVPAKIISWDLTTYAQTVTINVGFQDGLEPGQAVINIQGLVGQIIDEPGRVSGKSFAQVLLITDPTSRVSVLIERTRDRGIVEGTGKEDRLLLKYLSPEVKPLVGDTVLTSGLGGIFPPGIRVGVIEKVEQNPFAISPQCWIKPSVDFSHLEELLVITEGTRPQ